MDEGLVWIITIIGLTIVIVSGIVIHEAIETPYDKCLNTCYESNLESATLVECIDKCNKCPESASLVDQDRSEK